MRGARAALVFLTRLPGGRLEAADFARAPGWFAAVGLAIGAAMGVVWWAAAAVWPPILAALAALAIGMLLTGALHEDGLADTMDGLGSGRPADRALEIMRDSRIGSHGALALVMVLSAKVAALAALGTAAPLALVAAAGLSRAVMALMLRAGPYLRPTGAGSGMTGAWGLEGRLAWTGAVVVGGALAAVATGWALAGGVLGLGIGAGAVRFWALRRLGGLTGDVLGAAQQLGELGFLLGVLACL